MKKHCLFAIFVISTINQVFADNNTESNIVLTTSKTIKVESSIVPILQNPSASFIGSYNYFQNPYNWMLSGGGTLHLTESEYNTQNWAEKLFTDGTYNVFAGVTYNQWDGQYAASGKSYGGNIFAQTGQINGFSAGGLLSIMNPIGSFNDKVINPITPGNPNRYSSYYIPTYNSVTISEAFIEYQYSNIINIDVGYIAFDNSPWLAGNMYTNMLTVPTTYQGIGINVYAGNGWILSALGFNAAQFGAQQGFTGQTNYTSWLKTNNDYSTGSNGTVALGANYTDSSGKYNARLWGYQFDNYGTLLYGDGNINFPVNQKQSFSISGQLGTNQQWLQQNNSISQSINGGNIQSYIAGIKAGFTYDLFQLNLSANSMWGPSNSYNGGAFVSPYTQSLQVDPLYSEAWSYNMVTTGQPGNMYKVAGQFALGNWGTNLIFQPNYIYVSNDNLATNGLQELDLVLNYPIPQLRGLYLFGVYAQQWYKQNALNVPSNNYQPIEIQSGIYYTW
ncbi:MAG: hypothetical protein PHC75_03535 [Burkholderiales bacterium]|nr:hypothetical protein [Burkholderiales bacterium]